MAQASPEYSILEEYKDIASKIINRYPDKFFGIELERIQAYAITNKDNKNESKLFSIYAVKMPILLDSKYSHYVVFYQSDWDMLDNKHKLLLVSQTLCAIPLDENGSMEMEKVLTPNMKDYSRMLRTFGTDYLIKEDVPDILVEEVEWQD